MSYIKKRQMFEIGAIQELKDMGLEVDKSLILKKLASVGFETSLRTLERDIASIAATDAGMIMGKRYSGLAASPGTRYIKKIRDEQNRHDFSSKEWQTRQKRIRKTILKSKKTLDKATNDMDKFKSYLKKIEKQENEFRSKYGHLM
ncbi:MAG TPA: hypothetical protein VJ571_07820 [Candidatus Nitrosotalea sp.]|nr:hypothetical protein [Candidatus Nitrosotalea sp.]